MRVVRLSQWGKEGVLIIGCAVALSVALVAAGGWVGVVFGWVLTVAWVLVDEVMYRRGERRLRDELDRIKARRRSNRP